MKKTSAALAFPLLALAFLCGACDAPTGDDEEIDDEQEEVLGDAQQAITCLFGSTPGTPDATGTIVGAPASATSTGPGSGCDLHELRVTAAPSSGDKIQTVRVTSFAPGPCSNVEPIAKVWTKSLGYWSIANIDMTLTQNVEWVAGVPVQTCSGSGTKFYGFGGSSSITEVQVGARFGSSTFERDVTLEVIQAP